MRSESFLGSALVTVVGMGTVAAITAALLVAAGVGATPSRKDQIRAEADRVFEANIDSFDGSCQPDRIAHYSSAYLEIEPPPVAANRSGRRQQVAGSFVALFSPGHIRLSRDELFVFDERLRERIAEWCERQLDEHGRDDN